MAPPLAADGAPEAPESLELVEKLGKGSYGSVYRARYRETGETVAAKRIVLPRQDEEGYRAVQREISMLQECKHPNVVRYHGSHKIGDHVLWIVMEYCAGGSVSDLLRSQKCISPPPPLRPGLRGGCIPHANCNTVRQCFRAQGFRGSSHITDLSLITPRPPCPSHLSQLSIVPQPELVELSLDHAGHALRRLRALTQLDQACSHPLLRCQTFTGSRRLLPIGPASVEPHLLCRHQRHVSEHLRARQQRAQRPQ